MHAVVERGNSEVSWLDSTLYVMLVLHKVRASSTSLDEIYYFKE